MSMRKDVIAVLVATAVAISMHTFFCDVSHGADPIEVEKRPGNKEKTIKEVTQKWSSVMETYIRKYPEQWVWMHRRWKTKPEGIKK